ncbi:uncharacterized protein LOC121978181 [Zingiber officinale]|uniref:uncharacterized protein LOC121978181 n=1 Tax=Zingiber officinale TaxID=94328 RepID=UPI001C4D2D9A|nr:uncharacterized protein LOC121978181 [Zingiber officinale]
MDENYGEDQLYISQVVDDQKPKYGMEFSSIDEAFSLYNQYARESGFSARINSSKKNKITNEVVWKTFVCFKERHTDDQRNKQAKGDQQTRERTRGEVRTGCKSKISLVKKQTGSAWVVTDFTEAMEVALVTVVGHFMVDNVAILVELDEKLKAMIRTKRKMEKLKELLTIIDAVIEDVESHHSIVDSVKDLLKYLAYDLEDIVDYYGLPEEVEIKNFFKEKDHISFAENNNESVMYLHDVCL